jgi:hypothetical protein
VPLQVTDQDWSELLVVVRSQYSWTQASYLVC